MSDYALMSEEGRANVQGIIDALIEVGEKIGGWTAKYDGRQTGISYHAKFERKVDVLVALKFADQLGECPALLADACKKLLAADALLASLGYEIPA